jgi:hypothetical protein
MPPEKIQESSVLPKTQPSLWMPFVYAVISLAVGYAVGFVVGASGVFGDSTGLGGFFDVSEAIGILIIYVSILMSVGFLWVGFSGLVNILLKRERTFFGGYLLSSLVFVAAYLWWIFIGVK